MPELGESFTLVIIFHDPPELSVNIDLKLGEMAANYVASSMKQIW